MKKNVMRSLVVMLGLVMMFSMVLSCDDKPEEDPSKGKTVAEQYWGTFNRKLNNGSISNNTYITLSKENWEYYDINNKIQRNCRAWTEDNKLYYINELDNNKKELFGAFENVDTLKERDGGFTFIRQ